MAYRDWHSRMDLGRLGRTDVQAGAGLSGSSRLGADTGTSPPRGKPAISQRACPRSARALRKSAITLMNAWARCHGFSQSTATAWRKRPKWRSKKSRKHGSALKAPQPRLMLRQKSCVKTRSRRRKACSRARRRLPYARDDGCSTAIHARHVAVGQIER